MMRLQNSFLVYLLCILFAAANFALLNATQSTLYATDCDVVGRIPWESAMAVEDQEALQHEVAVTLKLIQVYVTDKDGNPIMDLNKDEFTLFDNGKIQKITAFEKHILPPLSTASAEEATLGTKSGKYKQASAMINRKFFLIIDTAQNDSTGISKAKKLALHFIEKQAIPDDEIGVLCYEKTSGLIINEFLTTNHKKAKEAVNRIRVIPGKRIGGWFLRRAYAQEEIEEMEEHAIESEDQAKVLHFIQSIKDFVKSIHYLDGNINIVLFSGGISSKKMHGTVKLKRAVPKVGESIRGDFYDKVKNDLVDSAREPMLVDFSDNVRNELDDMGNALASSGASVFSINTAGMRAQLQKREDRGEDSLRFISKISGGKYYNNVDYYETISQEIQITTGNYYVFGYYVDDKYDGEFHTVKVTTSRKDSHVMAQKGYFNPKPFSKFSGYEKNLHLIDLILSDKHHSQTPLAFPLISLCCPGNNESNLVLLAEIPIEELPGVTGAQTEITTLIRDNENTIVESGKTEVNFSSFKRKSIYHYMTASLPPGQYECKTILRNLSTGRGAIGSTAIIIPETQESGLTAYAPLLFVPGEKSVILKSSKDGKDNEEGPSFGKFYPIAPKGWIPLVGAIDQGTNRLMAELCYSISGIKEREIEISVSIIKALSEHKVTVFHTFLTSRDIDKIRAVLLGLDLPELPPGEYTLSFFLLEKSSGYKTRADRILKVR